MRLIRIATIALILITLVCTIACEPTLTNTSMPTPTTSPTPLLTPTPSPLPTATPTPFLAPTNSATPIPWPNKCGSPCCMGFEDLGSSMVIPCGTHWDGDVFSYNGSFIYDDEPYRGYGNLRDPSYAELTDFLAADKTDEIPYSRPDFMCQHFSLTLRENANKQGWRCAYVEIDSVPIEGGYGINYAHAIVAFNTTDRGLIYIEPQNDDRCQIIGETQPYCYCTENIDELSTICNIRPNNYIFRIIRIW